MCAVYAPTIRSSWVQDVFGLDLPVLAKDVYPGQLGPIVVKSQKQQRLAIGLARFGLLPSWAKDPGLGRHTYNARLETVADKPSYRGAWRSRQFAIVLADRFYEPSYATGKAQRWAIESADRNPMGIASLWDRWVCAQSGKVVASFTMLTINADDHPVMNQFHRPGDEKRTPFVLAAHAFDAWLSATPDTAKELLTPKTMENVVSYLAAS
jgi:putative SOS response-associated peptidase YedK